MTIESKHSKQGNNLGILEDATLAAQAERSKQSGR
jgi:hypothetical protein